MELSLCATLLKIALLLLAVLFVIIWRTFFHYKYWCHITADISASFDGGKTYEKNFPHAITNKAVYLKYEISARAYGFLSGFRKRKIRFTIEVQEVPETQSPQNLNVKLYDYKGKCDSFLGKDLRILKDASFALCAKGKKAETVKIVLKCEPSGTTNPSLALFKLAFADPYFKQKYSRTLALEFAKYRY